MTDCSKCETKGICCAVIVHLKQSGLTFFNREPAYICSKLNPETGLCTDYENRPEQCKKWDCDNNPRPMHLMIDGRQKDGMV